MIRANGHLTRATSGGIACRVGRVVAIGGGRIGSIFGRKAGQTVESCLRKWLRVTPEEPQGITWLTPTGIDYTIESNTDWNIV